MPESAAILSRTEQDTVDDSSSDQNLVEACLRGEQMAWNVLIQRYGRLIYSIPIRFGFSQTLADEVFQEVCIAVLEKLSTLRDRQRLSTWLVTITRRVCIQYLRQKTPEVSLEHVDGETMVDHSHDEHEFVAEDYEQLHRALALLDERCQKLIYALFFESPVHSYEEIAQNLELSMGSIGPVRARCLAKLHKAIMSLQKRNYSSTV